MIIVGGGACVPLGDPNAAVTTWETTLAATFGYPGVTGQAAAVSRPNGTQLGVGMDGAPPGATLAWGLGLGTCDAPGAQVGPDSDYPELSVDLTGSVDAVTELGPQLATDQSYYVEVRASATDPARVACGDLHQVEVTSGT